MAPYIPKYVSPEQAAQARARLRSRLFWLAVSLPVLLALLAFGYSDQAPNFLRTMTINLDRLFGYPILNLISAIASR
jgi:hypothetical protein